MGRGISGLVGQSMTGGRLPSPMPAAMPIIDNSGFGSVTASRDCIALIFAWGAGGGGTSSQGSNNGAGGGGGAALFKRYPLAAGQKISWVTGGPGPQASVDQVPAYDGTDTTVTLPGGLVLRAGGGQGAQTLRIPGKGGVASGGDINRRGGSGGGQDASVTPDAETIPYGATPAIGSGSGTSVAGGGGSSPGFPDIAADILGASGGNGANGGQSLAGSIPGGGGGGNRNPGAASGGQGAHGRVIIILVSS